MNEIIGFSSEIFQLRLYLLSLGLQQIVRFLKQSKLASVKQYGNTQ